MSTFDISDLKKALGIGVAGNFAGHLDQAGESDAFSTVQTKAKAPKGIFPFYIPGSANHFLHTFPLTSGAIHHPGADFNLQIEPELGVICKLSYDGSNHVKAVQPIKFSAFNDISIRIADEKKLSTKKNWGHNTKGFCTHLVDIDSFGPGGILDNYRIASYVMRDGQLIEYGTNSAVTSYSYFYEQLINWMIDRLNFQEDAGPLEFMRGWVETAGHPQYALVAVGATAYTDFGSHNFLKVGDRAYVVIYNEKQYGRDQIEDSIKKNQLTHQAGLCFLNQEIIE